MITIFSARRIVTQTAEAPQAFAVSGERIVATGGAAELEARFPGAERIDFGDAVLTPGFNDAHAHLAMAMEDVLHLDLSMKAIRSLADLTERVRAQAAATPSGAWVRGSRYDDAKMPEKRVLTRWDLDEVAPDHPVMVLHVAGHWGVVNSRALELGGLHDTSEAPAGGAFGRDGSGRLNGILFEQAIFDYAYPSVARRATTVVPASSMDDRLRGIRIAQQMFHAAGMTSIGDALVGPDDLAVFQEAEQRGDLTMRVNALVTLEHYDGLRKLRLRTGFGGDRLKIGGVKTFVDGAIGGRTCLLEHPFEGTTDDFGMQTNTTAALRDAVKMVHGDGNRICVHANGDRAIAILLGLLEESAAADPRPQIRHRIEHCSVVTEEIVQRMKRLRAIATPFAGYVAYHGGKLAEWYGAKRLERMFAHRWFLDAGVGVAGSSDYPCGPYEPLYGMQSCVTRRGEDGVLLGPSQRVTQHEALALFTTGSAEAAGEAHEKGRIAPGYLADFVVLEDDPTTVAPETISAIPVRATYVGGTRVWAAA